MSDNTLRADIQIYSVVSKNRPKADALLFRQLPAGREARRVSAPVGAKPQEVKRLLDWARTTKIDTIAEVLRALEKELVRRNPAAE